MKSFREHIKLQENEVEEVWTKQDLIDLINEEDLDFEDIQEITELITEIVEYGEFDDMEDADLESLDYDFDSQWANENEEIVDEKMSPKAKKEAAKKRKKPAFKKAQRLKKKCMDKKGDTVRKSKGKIVCGTDGKTHKGMSRGDKRKLMKSRKKNKSKIIK